MVLPISRYYFCCSHGVPPGLGDSQSCCGFWVVLFLSIGYGVFFFLFWYVFSSGATAGCFNRLSHSHFKNWLIFHCISYHCRCSLTASPVVQMVKQRGKAELLKWTASLSNTKIFIPNMFTLCSVGWGRCALVWMGSQKALDLSTRGVLFHTDLFKRKCLKHKNNL